MMTRESTLSETTSRPQTPILSLGSAHLEACRRWSAGTAGTAGHRIGFAVLRHKNVVRRLRGRVSHAGERETRVLGRASSWPGS